MLLRIVANGRRRLVVVAAAAARGVEQFVVNMRHLLLQAWHILIAVTVIDTHAALLNKLLDSFDGRQGFAFDRARLVGVRVQAFVQQVVLQVVHRLVYLLDEVVLGGVEAWSSTRSLLLELTIR